MLKKDAIELATKYGWTKTNAQLALANKDTKNAEEAQIIEWLLEWAGLELRGLKKELGKKKAEVAKAKTKLEKMQEILENREQELKNQKSFYIPIIERIYNFANRVGLKDPWIETMIAQYHIYNDKEAA